MGHTLNDMKDAFSFFNDKLFKGRLPPTKGKRRTEITFADFPHVAEHQRMPHGSDIRFSREHFGKDLDFDLSTLVHEMTHADADRNTEGGHDDVWRAWMTALGFETDAKGRETVIPGGKFDKAREEWKQRWRSGSRSQEDTDDGYPPRHPPSSIGQGGSGADITKQFGLYALTALVMIGGFFLVVALSVGGGGGRRYSSSYDDGYSRGYYGNSGGYGGNYGGYRRGSRWEDDD